MILEIIFLLITAVMYGVLIDTIIEEIRIKRKPVFKWDRQPVYKELAGVVLFILALLYTCIKLGLTVKDLF